MTDDRDPGLPIKLEPCSNAEYVPLPMSDVVREAIRRARALCDRNARRLGLSRREFLLSSMGAATTLAALSACASESRSQRRGRAGAGGRYEVPDEATIDPDAALETLGSDQPVIDVHTHFLEYPPEMADPGLMADVYDGEYRDCGDLATNDCFRADRWIEEVFLRSDTTMAVISTVPHSFVLPGPAPVTAEIMAEGRRKLERVCGDGRVLVHGHGQPNLGRLEDQLAAMEDEVGRYDISAWKSYTHVGPGWTLDDSHGVPVGLAYLERVRDLGIDIVCIHKGFSWVGTAGDPVFAQAGDVGPAARAFPDLRFCVYHAAYEPGVPERPYDPAAPNVGIDTLIRGLEDAGVGPGANVYVELASAWREVMGDPDEAAHVLGKLLLAVGADRILWGTDSIWYGSPQDQIQALRAFQITPELQDRHGYPALTDEIKAKILWRNAARLYDLDPHRFACRREPEDAEAARRTTPLANRTYGPRTAAMSRRLFLASHPWA
jgi:predicted TIM-barrel fold metal-dependent hydrolase